MLICFCTGSEFAKHFWKWCELPARNKHDENFLNDVPSFQFWDRFVFASSYSFPSDSIPCQCWTRRRRDAQYCGTRRPSASDKWSPAASPSVGPAWRPAAAGSAAAPLHAAVMPIRCPSCALPEMVILK